MPGDKGYAGDMGKTLKVPAGGPAIIKAAPDANALEALEARIRLLEEENRRLQELCRSKSEFLANASHDLKSPLNTIMGSMKLILDGLVDDPKEQMEYIKGAYDSSEHLLEIINDILDMARADAGKLNLEIQSVEVMAILEDVQMLTRQMAVQKGLELKIDLGGVAPQTEVRCDPRRVKQVLANIIFNSIKFTSLGSITIFTKEETGMMKFMVTDTGIGLAIADPEVLFEPFKQESKDTNKGYGGTGLGLAISKKMVTAMGGTIGIYSDGPGKGTTVWFTLTRAATARHREKD